MLANHVRSRWGSLARCLRGLPLSDCPASAKTAADNDESNVIWISAAQPTCTVDQLEGLRIPCPISLHLHSAALHLIF
jgi:hypothetical protein